MFRLVIYSLILISLGLFFSWLPGHVSDIVLTYQQWEITISSVIFFGALLLTGVIIATIMLVTYNIISIPSYISKHVQKKREEKAQSALIKSFIAILAGDLTTLKREERDLKKLANYKNNIFVDIIHIQQSILTEQNGDTIKLYEKLLKNPTTKVFGLYGLYGEAQKNHAFADALSYAKQAIDIAPQTPWAQQELLSHLVRNDNWSEALVQIDKSLKASDKATKKQNQRLKTVILTGAAEYYKERNPDLALKYLKQALKLTPNFVPAMTLRSNILFCQGKGKKSIQYLLKGWKETAHADLALLYVERSGYATSIEKLNRVNQLLDLGITTPFLQLLRARSLLETGNSKQARKVIDQLIITNPSEHAYLLLADIEEIDTGNQALVKQWLSKARFAPKDATWVGEGKISSVWLPYSTTSGKLDVFEWKVPDIEIANAITIDETETAHYHHLESKNNLQEIHILTDDQDPMMVFDDPGIEKPKTA